MTNDINGAMRRATTLALGVPLLCAVAISMHATTVTVTNTNDSGPGSLRQALADANDHDTITFSVTGTIGLTSGELLVNKVITISGPGAASLALDGNGNSRVFHIGSRRPVSISGLTITNGNGASGGGGAIWNDHGALTLNNCAVDFNRTAYLAGGIYNDGLNGTATTTILNSTVSGNFASYAGGGIYNDASDGGRATLTIMNSTINTNGAWYDDIPFGGGEGGGIYNDSGSLMITNSVVSNNHAGMDGPNFPTGTGGGISNYGTLTITDSAITGNQVYLFGGGIYNDGTLAINNSTVSDNGAIGQHDGDPWGTGGGVVNSGTLTITNSTLSGNGASLSGGGIEGTSTLENTILNANSPENILGGAVSRGYNLSSDDGGGYLNGPGDQINTDPMLGPLQDNGGSTLTHALLPGSPAIDAGNPNFTPPPFYDQRGLDFYRVRNGRIDKGSFEVRAGSTPAPTSTPRPAPTPRPRATPCPCPSPPHSLTMEWNDCVCR